MALTTEIFSRMVGKVVTVVRENCLAPRAINRSYAASLEERGNTVNVPITGALAVRDINPSVIAPSTNEPAPKTVAVSLDNWKESAFVINDKDLSGLDDSESWINKQLEEAGRAIANTVDASILALYKDVPHHAGTAGTTPFSTSTIELQQAERILITNLAPRGNRKLILDPFAHANALGLQVFQNNFNLGAETIRDGMIRRALGYEWGYSQNVLQHTKGTATGTPLVNTTQPVGATNLPTKGWTPLTGNILRQGDIITIAGDSTNYVVTVNCSSDASGNATVPISNGFSTQSSGLLVQATDNAAITVVGSHRVNLALHPDFGAFASRIASNLTRAGNAAFEQRWVDPVSGLALLVQIDAQYYQTMFSVSCMWGCKTVRPEFAVRIKG